METKKYKYSGEYSIGMYLSRYHFLKQGDLKEFASKQDTFTKNTPCNIYFILRRPRVSLDPGYLKETQNSVELKYFIHDKSERIERFIQFHKPNEFNGFRLMSEYPYNRFKLTNSQGGAIISDLAVFIDELHKNKYVDDRKMDYDVLYIGQAFGRNGKRTAIDRLDSHSTLQKIYSEAISKNPDSEIWIMLAHFSEQKIGTMSGLIETLKEHEKEDLDRFKKYMSSEKSNFSDKQKINFTEAALIQKFQPPYNKEYKGTFPSGSHSSYKECYDLGVNGIVIELDTREARRRLNAVNKDLDAYKESTTPFWQFSQFHFVNEQDRYKMFNNEFM